MPRVILAVVTVLLLAAAPAAASGSLPLDAHVSARAASAASCIDARRGGPAVALRRLTATRGGYLTARLDGGAAGDWDLAVFARGSREPVAASAYSASTEVASGFVHAGDRLTVQACRRSSDAR